MAGEESPNPHYQRLGGAEVPRAPVDRFCDLMDELPEAYAGRPLRPPELAQSREKLFMFLSGWLGGPPLDVERYGHPLLRARHLPFAIGNAERDQWLECMYQAMADVGIADRMCNQN